VPVSFFGMTWALHDAPVDDSTAVLVLLGLAERAHDDGTSAYPSVAWLSKRARCSTRTVHRHLRQLEADGLIRRGDQRFVEHLPSDRRPVVYDVDFTRRRGDKTSHRGPDGVTPTTQRGDTDDITGVTPVSHKPVLEPIQNQSTADTSAGRSQVDTEFDRFWQVYDRKVERKAAREAWGKALKKPGVTADLLVDAAAAYVAEQRRQGKHPTYTIHAARWLRNERWNDEPAAPGPTTRKPPRRDEECPDHPGQWAGNCAGCAADRLEATQPRVVQQPREEKPRLPRRRDIEKTENDQPGGTT
jgi:hypothetical protein